MRKASSTQQSEIVGYTVVRRDTDTNASLEVSGQWLRDARIKPVEQVVAELESRPVKRLSILPVELADWDSRLPSYLLKIADYCVAKAIELDVSAMPQGVQDLLALARAVPERSGARRREERAPFLANVGNSVLNLIEDSRQLVIFLGELILAVGEVLRGQARFRALDLFIFVQDAGPNGFPIVSLISLLVGLILAFVGALQLAMFGAQIYIADLVALGTVREMGPLMTAIIMSGRTGAAYAAQLGTMNVNSEIDALKTMGISPMEFLVIPRMLALVLMMPLLTLYADLLGILGGAAVSYGAFDVSITQYYHEITKAVDIVDFSVGFFKSVVFAVLIAIAGCMRGMACGRSASAVGDAATAAVVDSIVYIVVSDSLITLILNQMRI
ncbi:MAG: ABC transporter permease [Methylomonas sp.]|jgi:phospholipid/cholesterol/gamma-HCH transport system permease protein|uniref:MlaE family ABC transporter permease n=1 Tax=Methylomonas sp. TaxID=418 RepID=UPI0025EFFBD6|nr:ABC transporter permease [Methylomonas sp.]MCK9606469.1 ABC transporter permease [Methylomonas sp.]